MLAHGILLVTLAAAGWVDISRGPACLDAARIQAALERRAGPRSNREQVIVERLSGDDVRVSLRRGSVMIASRELRVDSASCAAAERTIALLVVSWWKLPSPAPAPPPPPRRDEAPPVATPEPPPPAEPPVAEPSPPPPPAPVVAALPPVTVFGEEPPRPSLSPWRWSFGAEGVVLFDGQTGWAGMVRGGGGLRDGFGASLDLGIEGQRLGSDSIGTVGVTPSFATLSADWEHRFSRVHLEAGAGVRLYAFTARSAGFDANFQPVTLAPAVAARVAVRFPVWRGLFVVAGVTAGSRFRPEGFIIRGADARVIVDPAFAQATLGFGVGSK